MTAVIREARCSCGQLHVTCEGEPVRRSVCHCLDCQRRTGSPFGCTGWFPTEQVRAEGDASTWSRLGDEGTRATFRFCPTCGSTVWWTCDMAPERVAVAVGAFADPLFPPPGVSVYENRKHRWVDHFADLDLERY